MKNKRYIAYCVLISLLSGCSVLDSIIPSRDSASKPSIPDAVFEEHEGKMPSAESLPIYPENLKEKLAVCVDNMQGKTESAFVTLIDSVIAQNAIPQSNAVYLAPYVVDAKYNDCINTISADLYGILAQNGYAPVKGNSSISQNSGSRTLIPALIRHCRSQNIPYVVLGAIEDINKAPSASLKIIDVKSGAILFNQHKTLN